jgi:hypothetical protein
MDWRRTVNHLARTTLAGLLAATVATAVTRTTSALLATWVRTVHIAVMRIIVMYRRRPMMHGRATVMDRRRAMMRRCFVIIATVDWRAAVVNRRFMMNHRR